jgi:hypothetical protein
MSSIPLTQVENRTPVQLTRYDTIPEDAVSRICSICKETLQNPVIGHENGIVSHLFHETCITPASLEQPACPLCPADAADSAPVAQRRLAIADAVEEVPYSHLVNPADREIELGKPVCIICLGVCVVIGIAITGILININKS